MDQSVTFTINRPPITLLLLSENSGIPISTIILHVDSSIIPKLKEEFSKKNKKTRIHTIAGKQSNSYRQLLYLLETAQMQHLYSHSSYFP